MIEIRNVTKKLGDRTVINNLSLTVGNSSIYGLVGCNGAGKTTVLKMIADVYRADKGDVLVNGESVKNNAAVKQHIFYIPDALYFTPRDTVKSMERFYRSYYPRFDTEVFAKMMKSFGFDKTLHLGSASRGMQRQVELALAIASRADVLLIDECFDGLDAVKRRRISEILMEYMAEFDCSVIISSHSLYELSDRFCDHIALLDEKSGNIVLDVSVDDADGSRVKMRGAYFDRLVDKSEFGDLKMKSYRCDRLSLNRKPGCRISFSVSAGDEDKVIEKLEAMGAFAIEDNFLQMRAYDIFLEEMEEMNYES